MEKKFIEWDLPLKEISKRSSKEKYLSHKHISTLHVWWARRPLSSSRTTIFSSLLNLPDQQEEREEINDLIRDIAPMSAIKNGNINSIDKAKEKILNQYEEPPKILDPFAGGGAIPLEALRLGCTTYASDYNPVAVLIEKCTLEFPQKFSKNIEIPVEEALQSELKDSNYTPKQLEKFETSSKEAQKTIEVNELNHLVKKYANNLLSKTKNEIGQFFPKEESKRLVGKEKTKHSDGWTPLGYIWARTIPCQNPSCNAEIPLTKSFWLSKKKNIFYKPINLDNEGELKFEISKEDSDFSPNEGTVSRGNAECIVCSQVTKSKEVKKLAKEGKMDRKMIAIVFHHPDESGKQFRIANEDDLKIYEKASKYLQEKIEGYDEFGYAPLPTESTPKSKGRGAERAFSIRKYGLKEWKDLFNDRQKLVMLSFSENVKQIHKNLQESGMKKEKANAITSYLAIMVSKFSMSTNELTRWNHSSESIVGEPDQFGVLGMKWDYIENNPFSNATGSFKNHMETILKVDVNLFEGEKAVAEQASVKNLPFSNEYFDAVFTDPPYYDNIPYSYLSDFFYVWLKRMLQDIYPDLFSTPLTPKNDELVVYTKNQDWEESKEGFERGMEEGFKEIKRVLKPDGVFTLVYAHKTTEGWETMLNSLYRAGFVVTASWPIHTEMKSRLRAAASAALASSIYIVCRKTEREDVGFWKDIKPKIKQKIENKLQQFWNEGIVGGDFFISAIGPGMEIYSQYERVEKYSGDKVSTLDLLEYVRSIATDFVVNNLLKDASSTELDPASQFYLSYRWTYLDNKVEFDDARRIASGMGIELDEFAGKDGFVKQARKYTSILGPQDREEVEKIDNMVDLMHKCVLLWDEGKTDKIKQLLSKTGYGEKPAFWQFCQAVAETLLNGNKEKQLLEGFLTGKDKYSKSSKDDEQKDLDQFGGD